MRILITPSHPKPTAGRTPLPKASYCKENNGRGKAHLRDVTNYVDTGWMFSPSQPHKNTPDRQSGRVGYNGVLHPQSRGCQRLTRPVMQLFENPHYHLLFHLIQIYFYYLLYQ